MIKIAKKLMCELQEVMANYQKSTEKITGFKDIAPSIRDTRITDYKRQMLNNAYLKIVKKRNRLHSILQKSLPLELNEENEHALTSFGLPIVYSYEEVVKDSFYLMYDVTHGFGENIPRVEVYINGLRKIKPTKLFLEFSINVDKIIRMYYAGEIDVDELSEYIFEDSFSSGMTRFSPLIDYAKENNIRVRCVDLPHPKNMIPLLPETFYPSINPSSNEYYKICKELGDMQTFIREENIFNGILDEMSGNDKGALIIGSAHRLTFPDFLKTIIEEKKS